jgi:hypothetical protein
MLWLGSKNGLHDPEGMAARDHRMANEVELASLDLRYESFRLKQAALEERLLSSIAQPQHRPGHYPARRRDAAARAHGQEAAR